MEAPVSSHHDASRDGPERLGLLASALAGRALQVAAAGPGEPAWTDGSTIYLDAALGATEQVEALAVQASLLAAGSLDPGVVRRLTRRPLARRYLGVEGHRALAAIQHLLPPSVRSLVDPGIAARSDSPAASLAVARSRDAIPDPPVRFGAIRARRLLASIRRAERAATSGDAKDLPRNQLELAEDEDRDAGMATDFVSSRDGGSIGRLLQRMLGIARRQGGGPPAADAPTHRTHTEGRGGSSAAVSTGTAGPAEAAAADGRGARYPEWDARLGRYREDWCTVREVEPRVSERAFVPAPDGYGLRRPLARLGMGLDRHRRREQGDDIDLDAAIEARVEVRAGSAPDEAFYVESLRRRRDLSVLILLDASGSVAEAGATGQPVHEQQRAAAAALAMALHEIGDRVALYAYHSRGRSAVHLEPVKRFDDDLDTLVWQRLHGLVPGAYSRLGAAIRHSAGVLERQGGTTRRLLVVLSDGLAYDHGYELGYGAADARRALAEARRRGTGCLCLSLGADLDAETLRRVFGSAAHATVPRTDQLRQVVGPLFRSALRAAEVLRPGARRAGSQIAD